MKIILGVSASVAIYKAADIARVLMRERAEVTAVMTPNAARLVDPRLFDAVTGRRTITDLFAREEAFSHLATARDAVAFAVAPATANVLGKFAAGVADDALTTTALAVRCPRLVAPAMNPSMWEKPEVQRNVASLRDDGWRVVSPGEGRAACGDEGVGRLAPVGVIVEDILTAAFTRPPFAGKTLVITAGPTREPFDAVRVLSNPSSGLMGHELARRAARRGADVILISGALSVPDFGSGVKVIRVDTAEEMFKATSVAFANADGLIMAAAVSDYKPERVDNGKTKKTNMKLSISLVPTVDILTELANNKGDRPIIGFAAESDNYIKYAKDKLLNKNIDIVFANIIGSSIFGFNVENVNAAVVTRDGIRELGVIAKDKAAEVILDEMEGFWLRG